MHQRLQSDLLEYPEATALAIYLKSILPNLCFLNYSINPPEIYLFILTAPLSFFTTPIIYLKLVQVAVALNSTNLQQVEEQVLLVYIFFRDANLEQWQILSRSNQWRSEFQFGPIKIIKPVVFSSNKLFA